MIDMKIEHLAKEVENRFFSSGESLNSSIVKIAEREGLSANLTQRLVEKSNETVLLSKIAKDGTQDFEVANPEAIFKALNSQEPEKTAEENTFSSFNYDPESEKTAEEEPDPPLTMTELRYIANKTINKVAEDRDKHFMVCYRIVREIGKATQNTDMSKIASFMETKVADTDEIGDKARKFVSHYAEYQRMDRIHDFMLKEASFWTSLAKGGIKTIGGGAYKVGQGLSSAAKGLSKATRPLYTKPKTIFKERQIPSSVISREKWGDLFHGSGKIRVAPMKPDSWLGKIKKKVGLAKPKSDIAKSLDQSIPAIEKIKNKRVFSTGRALGTTFGGGAILGGAMPSTKPKYTTNLPKTASWRESLTKMLAHPLGTVTAVSLGGVGGNLLYDTIQNHKMTSRMNESFNIALEDHPELGGDNLPQTRRYLESITRHSPSIAQDPLVLGQLLKQFHMFGGPDYRTIQDLRMTETKTAPSKPNLMDTSSRAIGTGATLHKMMNPEKKKTDEEKTASIKGIGTSYVKTYHGGSPLEIIETKRREAEGKIRGKTVGGATGGLAGLLASKGGGWKSKVLAATASGLIGGWLGKQVGGSIATKGKVEKTPIRFNATPSEELAAAIKNIQKNPGQVYLHQVKKNVLAGL
ncbi:MAG: hypothetical protein SVK08_01815 [Halobacteriota archaeon]|nr:hypothetical protein [Halobacteriota archaeon]